jgi:HPr kinase/phosphorylase
VHGTCVALGSSAALLRGRSGAGKSDLALRFIAASGASSPAAQLVADDQVWVEARGQSGLFAFPPAPLAGKIEVRGLGILEMPYLAEATLMLVVDLVEPHVVPRMPAEPLPHVVIAGVAVPLLRLAPFEISAPIKLKLGLSAVRSYRSRA